MTLPPEYLIYAKGFVALVAIANPVGAIPALLLLTKDASRTERARVVRRCSLAAGGILIGAVWFGDALLAFFGIGIPAFRAGGGILIVLMAVSMLHARMSHVRQTPSEVESAQDKEDVAIVPLAIPLIAGPGAISLSIVSANQVPSWTGRLGLSVSVLLFIGLLWVVLRLGDPIARRLGETGLNVVTRIMGLILVAIGVQMITGGLKELLPGLAG